MEQKQISAGGGSNTDSVKFDSTQSSETHPKYRMLKTIAQYIIFFTIGYTPNSIGPTLVQMELYLKTDTMTLSWVFTSYSIGSVIGSTICGILFDRLNPELTLVISGIGAGLSYALAPYIGGLYGYIAFLSVCGLFSGFVNAGTQSYIVGLWEGTRWKEPSLQGVHMAWSLGATLGPVIVRAFLTNIQLEAAARYDMNSTGLATQMAFDPAPVTEMVVSKGTKSLMHPGYSFSNMVTGNSTEPAQEYGSVRFAYLTLGLFSVMARVPLAIVFVCDGLTLRRKSNTKLINMEGKDSRSHQSKSFVLKIQILMFLSYTFYAVVQSAPGNFLAAFAIKELSWENHQGAMIASVLWAANGVGRLWGVPLSLIMSPKVMLILNLALQILAFTLMNFIHYHTSIMWLSIALLGLGMSTTFASGILWMSEYVKISGFSSAVLMVGSSTGSITCPVFVGYMFDKFSPMWLIYIGLTAAILQCISFIAADIFARWKFVQYIPTSNVHVNDSKNFTGNTETEPFQYSQSDFD